MHIQLYLLSYNTHIKAYLPTLGFRHIQDSGNIKQRRSSNQIPPTPLRNSTTFLKPQSFLTLIENLSKTGGHCPFGIGEEAFLEHHANK